MVTQTANLTNSCSIKYRTILNQRIENQANKKTQVRLKLRMKILMNQNSPSQKITSEKLNKSTRTMKTFSKNR